MELINKRLSKKFGKHWIKVKFYEEGPSLENIQRPNHIRFCEATKKAILNPILLNKEHISCPGALYTMGWDSRFPHQLFNNWDSKNENQKNLLRSLVSQIPVLDSGVEYIGLNTEGESDMVMAYLSPDEAMELIKLLNFSFGINVKTSLFSVMSICGGIAVNTFQREKISLSFGCDNCRNYANMHRFEVAVGIPRSMYHLFVD
ncbi:MAG: DUF169 domain-containing protein [Spirochaetota bacterium]